MTENQLSAAYPDDEMMDMVRPEYVFPKPLDPSLINMGAQMMMRPHEDDLHPALALEAKRREAAISRPHVDVVSIQQQKADKVRPVPVVVDPATMTSVGDNFHGYHLVKDLKGDCARLFLKAAADLTPKVEESSPHSQLGGIVDAESDLKKIMKEETDGGVSSLYAKVYLIALCVHTLRTSPTRSKVESLLLLFL